jgi:hypothetical protein
VIPTFDIEALEWTTPIAVGFYDGKEYFEFLKVSEDHDVIWSFLEFVKKYKGIKIYAHNAAAYDNKFILDCLAKHGEEVRFPSGLGTLIWVGPGIRFEDSFLLLGRKLAVCCEAFNVSRKLEWKHDETVNPWLMGPRLTEFSAYLKRDCIALSEVLVAYSKSLTENFGVPPSFTMALTAMKAFDKRFFPLKEISSNDDFDFFIRSATYGSRNEVYKRYGENLNFYDVKRMFMSCYDTPVPIGKMHWTSLNIDKGTLAEARVWVDPKKFFIGPLPCRVEGRLTFPVGELPKTWWDMAELRYAASSGVDITLTKQLECAEAPILKEFGEFITTLSKSSNAHMGRIWKLFGLRLSGKFGQHLLATEIKHVKQLEDGQYNPIDSSEIYHEVLAKSSQYKSPYIKRAINMRVRAEARIRHLKLMLEAKDVYYCDTDSIDTPNEMVTGDNPGELSYVDFAKRAYFINGKFYGYVDREGVLKQKTAGYRDYQLTENDFKRVLKGEEIPVSYRRIGDWKSVLRGLGVTYDEHVFTYKPPDTSNRDMGEIETSPIKLVSGKRIN